MKSKIEQVFIGTIEGVEFLDSHVFEIVKAAIVMLENSIKVDGLNQNTIEGTKQYVYESLSSGVQASIIKGVLKTFSSLASSQEDFCNRLLPTSQYRSLKVKGG